MLDPTNLYEIETQSRLRYQERLHESNQWRLAKLAQQPTDRQSNQLSAKRSSLFEFLRKRLPLWQPKTSHAAKASKMVTPLT